MSIFFTTSSLRDSYGEARNRVFLTTSRLRRTPPIHFVAEGELCIRWGVMANKIEKSTSWVLFCYE